MQKRIETAYAHPRRMSALRSVDVMVLVHVVHPCDEWTCLSIDGSTASIFPAHGGAPTGARERPETYQKRRTGLAPTACIVTQRSNGARSRTLRVSTGQRRSDGRQLRCGQTAVSSIV